MRFSRFLEGFVRDDQFILLGICNGLRQRPHKLQFMEFCYCVGTSRFVIRRVERVTLVSLHLDTSLKPFEVSSTMNTLLVL
jgi:hypothetical protein